VDLYIHSPISLHSAVFNSLSTGTTLPLEDKEHCRVEISNRFAALEDLDPEVDIVNRAWKSVKENIKTSAEESLVIMN
jgi:hypothetical protein